MKLSDSEKRDLIKLIEKGKNLPEKYRFLLFEDTNQVELNWNGKSSEVTNIVLPFQVIEQVDEPREENIQFVQQELIDSESGRQQMGWTNKLIWGDNKYILSSLKNGPMREDIESQGGIKLIYIDPPFDVGADFSMNLNIGDSLYEKKPNVLEQIAYRDTWGLGQDSFFSMIYERLLLMKDLLADDGSIFVHCDWRVVSGLRLILNEVFGLSNFQNEIIWKRTSSKLKALSNSFLAVNDYILYYSKSDKKKYNLIYGDYSEEYKKRFNLKDEFGDYYWAPIGSYSQERYEKLKSEGRLKHNEGKMPRMKHYLHEGKGVPPDNLWVDIDNVNSQAKERVGYPTQKPEKLLERIIKTSSDENDLIADFFCGSGTTAAVAEKLNRKWICTDLGKFSIHTVRKRLIGIQRKKKEENQVYRAFEILNLGKYQREHFIYDGKFEREEIKKFQRQQKEKDFENLILEAYKANNISGFRTIHGKKGSNFVSLGPINQPLSRNHVEEVILECLNNNIISVDILGFEYEMGLFPTIQQEAKDKGLRLTYKQIPMDIFDKRAVSKNQVIFHDVASIDFRVHKNGNNISIELIDFAVFYSEDNLNLDEKIQKGKSKIFAENGNIIEKYKNKEGEISEKVITKSWTDWVDYWSVDFNYQSKKEFITIQKHNTNKQLWTGNYIFENEWQSFRSSKNGDSLELKTVEKEILSETTTVAVKVIDIFGNDTMKLLEVKI